MEEWWKHHSSPQDPEWHKWIDVYIPLYVEKLKELSEAHVNMVDNEAVFGMSKASGCTRAAGLKLLKYPEEPFGGSTKFTFFIGHTLEIAALATLVMTGYKLESTQYPVIIRNDLHGAGVQPIMQSTCDGVIKLLGETTLVSVKSTAYKMSGQRKGKWVRHGFPELPFQGIRKSQPSWYVQSQLEMAASGINQTLYVVVSKDIVKAFEKDDFLGEKGNGSLTFYAELIRAEPEIANRAIDAMTNQMYEARVNNSAGPALYVRPDSYQYVELEKANVQPSNIWGGKNKEITGTFNPCGGCAFVQVCKDAN